jgi:hypothetical protein
LAAGAPGEPHGRTGDLARKLPEWAALFAQVQAAPEGTEHLGVVIRYLLWIGDQSVQEATGRVLHSVLDEQRAEELMRSYGEELMKRGRQQGLARGRAETLLRLLAARGLHVDDANRQRILDCTDVATLDRWFDQALHATTLSEVLDGVTQ